MVFQKTTDIIQTINSQITGVVDGILVSSNHWCDFMRKIPQSFFLMTIKGSFHREEATKRRLLTEIQKVSESGDDRFKKLVSELVQVRKETATILIKRLYQFLSAYLAMFLIIIITF